MNKSGLLKKWSILCLTILFLSCGNNEQDFACTDIMDRINICDINESVNLTFRNGEVRCNNELANVEQFEQLDYVLSNLTVAYPLPKTDKDKFSESRFKTEGTQITIYRGAQHLKNFFLMFDSTRCYALMEGAKQVYIVSVPGVDHLKDIVKADASLWIHPLLFAYQVAEIQQIQFTDKHYPDQSWTIKQSASSYQLLADQTELPLPFDSIRMQRYLSYFNQVEFEGLLNTIDTTMLLYSLSVTTLTNTEMYWVYGIPSDKINDYGVPLVYDRDRFYLQVQSTNKRYLMKWINFDILLHHW